ncbi:MAG: hypothetical protein L3K26_09940, partial [Candidatus Hydrogenedentes bacterium]|nr:hypothetical protein [Candidatus Hydrogenedentota bacterium]
MGMCGAFYLVAISLLERPLRFGESGYPTIELLVSGVFAALPFLLHGIVHVLRRYLEYAQAARLTSKKKVFLFVLPLIPILAMVISLAPVAILAGMADAGSLIPHGAFELWLELAGMVTVKLALPGTQGIVRVFGVLLNGPAIALWLYLVSYASWLVLRLMRRPDDREHWGALRKRPF